SFSYELLKATAEAPGQSVDAAGLLEGVEVTARAHVLTSNAGDQVGLTHELICRRLVRIPSTLGPPRLALAAAIAIASRSAEQVAPPAFSPAEAFTDRTRMGAIAFAALGAAAQLWGGAVVADARGAMWLQRADQYTDPETAERAMVDVRRASWLPLDPGAQRSELAADAYRLAKRLGDRGAQFDAAAIGFLNNTGPLRLIPEALKVLRELMNEPRDKVSSPSLGLFLHFGGAYCLFCGD